MKKTTQLLATAALVFGSTLVFAQEPAPSTSQIPASAAQAPAPEATTRHKRPDPNVQTQRLAKRLNLDAGQQSKLLSILTTQQEQANALQQDQSISKEDRRTKMQQIRQDGVAQIRGILTDD